MIIHISYNYRIKYGLFKSLHFYLNGFTKFPFLRKRAYCLITGGGGRLIKRHLDMIPSQKIREKTMGHLENLKKGQRDMYF